MEPFWNILFLPFPFLVPSIQFKHLFMQAITVVSWLAPHFFSAHICPKCH